MNSSCLRKMKIIRNNDDFELNCYLEIIEYFKDNQINRDEREIWKSHSLIELMKFLARAKNRDLVSNAIILLLSLSEDKPLDIYSDRGMDINQIADGDKKLLIKRLMEEFLPN
ncbi:hypothetical protein LCGC14_1403820 [marine sediment metagenome]|uniref:Uncharacterized protein n=1 Tax=marine sediment metagenome TaxID=412755 RepID=A0A0F9MXV4_9ZZZZ